MGRATVFKETIYIHKREEHTSHLKSCLKFKWEGAIYISTLFLQVASLEIVSTQVARINTMLYLIRSQRTSKATSKQSMGDPGRGKRGIQQDLINKAQVLIKESALTTMRKCHPTI